MRVDFTKRTCFIVSLLLRPYVGFFFFSFVIMPRDVPVPYNETKEQYITTTGLLCYLAGVMPTRACFDEVDVLSLSS